MTSFHPKNCFCNFIGSKDSDPLDYSKEYISLVRKLPKIEILIIGNKAYDKGANGIAFCQNNWKDLLRGNRSGRYLLCSLGINLKKAQQNSWTPVDMFCLIAKCGIVFVNQESEELIQLLNKAQFVITCGDKIRKGIKEKIPSHTMLMNVPRHPATQGVENDLALNDDWHQYWGGFNKLFTKTNDYGLKRTGAKCIKKINYRFSCKVYRIVWSLVLLLKKF